MLLNEFSEAPSCFGDCLGVLLFLGEMLKRACFGIGKREDVRLKVEVERVSFVQLSLEMRRKVLSNGQAAYLLQKLKEIVEPFLFLWGDVFDESVARSVSALTPADVLDRRKCAVNDAAIDIANRNLQAKVLALLLRQIEPLECESAHT